MGTRSLTHIKSGDAESKTLLTFYRQCDGYPEGHGKELSAFLASKKLVNGFQNPKTEFNGVRCAAAQVISHLKGESAGSIYIHELDDRDCGEEFTYTVYLQGNDFHIRCEDGMIGSEVLYDGRVKDFQDWLSKMKAQVG